MERVAGIVLVLALVVLPTEASAELLVPWVDRDDDGWARVWTFSSAGPTETRSSFDIGAPVPSTRWKRAEATFVLSDGCDVRLSYGLPEKTQLALDGRRIHAGEGNEVLPLARQTTRRLEAGRHRLVVTAPRRKTDERFFVRVEPGSPCQLVWLAPVVDWPELIRGKISVDVTSVPWSAVFEASLPAAVPEDLPSAALSGGFANEERWADVLPGRPGLARRWTVALPDKQLAASLKIAGAIVARWPEPKSYGSRRGWRQRRTRLTRSGEAARADPLNWLLQQEAERLASVGRRHLLSDDELDDHLAGWDRNENPTPTLRAYRSPFDGRWQPYVLVARQGAKDRKLSLVVGLHGHRGTPWSMCRALRAGVDLARLAEWGLALVCPYGYGDSAFRYVGEDDLFRVIEAAWNEVEVERGPVHLVGASDGGLAAFEVGLHYPDRWASVTALAATGDMRALIGLPRGVGPPWQERWLDRVSSIERAVNALGMDWLVVYGGRDRFPAGAQKMAEALKAAGAQVEYREPPNSGHNVWTETFDNGEFLASLLTRNSRGRKPKKGAHDEVVYRSWSPRYRGAWGVDIVDGDWRSGFVEVRLRRDGTDHVLDSKRVRRVRLDARLARERGVHRVVVGGTSFPMDADKGLDLVFHRDGWKAESPTRAPWVTGPPYDRGLRGLAGMAGPLDELRADAPLFVYGTHEPRQTALLRYLATTDRDRWSRGIDIVMNVVGDRELTAAALVGQSLVLTGTPRSLPAIWLVAPGSVSLMHRHEGGLRAIFPHPVSSGHHVVVNLGRNPRDVSWTVHLPEMLPERVWSTGAGAIPPSGFRARQRTLSGWDSTYGPATTRGKRD